MCYFFSVALYKNIYSIVGYLKNSARKGFSKAPHMDNIFLYLMYVCVLCILNKVLFVLCSFLFKAEVPDSPVPARLEMPKFTPPNHLDPTIYPTEVGVSSMGRRGAGGQMLSTAIKITLDLQRNVKVQYYFNLPFLKMNHFLLLFSLMYPFSSQEFLVALRLEGATLRHHMALTNHSWHEQVSLLKRRWTDELLHDTINTV